MPQELVSQLPPWPNIIKTYLNLQRKLSDIKPDRLKIAVIDYWIGLLSLEKASIEAGQRRVSKGR